MRYTDIFLLVLTAVGCRSDLAVGTTVMMDVHGQKWSDLRGGALQASVLIEPMRRNGDLVFELLLSHGLDLDNPAAFFEPN